MNASDPPDPRINHDEIAARAYAIYQERGGAPGQALEHWLEAESRLRAQSLGNPAAVGNPQGGSPTDGPAADQGGGSHREAHRREHPGATAGRGPTKRDEVRRLGGRMIPRRFGR